VIRALFVPLLALAAAPAVAAGLLVQTDALAAELKAGAVRLVDAENPDAYARAHIPGAVHLYYMDLEDAEENAKTGLPIHAQLGATKLGAVGISRATPVIVYDSGDGRAASGVWHVLRFLGHENVRILDGGFRKWVREGRPVTQEAPAPRKAEFVPKPRTDWALRTEAVARPGALVLDARSVAEFSGKETGGARQGGHIPGAKSFPWTKLAGTLGTFKPPAEMRKALVDAGVTPDREIITYCNPGIGRSTFLAAALAELGYEKVKVYPGSWIEWASDPARPIER
jgi:thiosulfate/3-mercaptopyruvate sulfurtransferase